MEVEVIKTHRCENIYWGKRYLTDILSIKNTQLFSFGRDSSEHMVDKTIKCMSTGEMMLWKNISLVKTSHIPKRSMHSALFVVISVFFLSGLSIWVARLQSCLYHVCACLLGDTFQLAFVLQHKRAEHDSIWQASQDGGWCQQRIAIQLLDSEMTSKRARNLWLTGFPLVNEYRQVVL